MLGEWLWFAEGEDKRVAAVVFFFFSARRGHTIFDCDWSSDVCSSDLRGTARLRRPRATRQVRRPPPARSSAACPRSPPRRLLPSRPPSHAHGAPSTQRATSASDRKSVV